MTKIVELLENPKSDDDAKVLKINKLIGNSGQLLFDPFLPSIDFVHVGEGFFVRLKDENHKKIFNDWITSLYDELSKKDSIDEIIPIFNDKVKGFINLFEKGKKISESSIRGFYGELLELKDRLEEISRNQELNITDEEVLEGWHRPSPALHDFDYNHESVEIKTTGRSSGKIKISNEHQLTALNDKTLKIRIITLELIEKSNKDSVAELYLEIFNSLSDVNKVYFAKKCYSDTFFKYRGPEDMPINFKISVIDSSYYIVDQVKFPRISADNAEEKSIQGVMNGISSVKYSIDISSIEEFKCN